MNARGHHVKRRKRFRSCFDRRKNDERQRQHRSSTSHSHSTQTTSSPPAASTTFTELSQLAEVEMPEHWNAIPTTDSIDIYKLKRDASGRHHIAVNVTVRRNLSWTIRFEGKQVPTSCELFDDSPLFLTSPTTLHKVLTCLDSVVLCPGNPDEDFIALCKQRGGVMRGERGHGDVVASIDDIHVVDPWGDQYEQTLRRSDCALLCKLSTEYPQRCTACKLYRKTLRACIYKPSHDDPTAVSSHAPYSCLTLQQKDQRLKNLKQTLKVAKQHIRRLEVKVRNLIDKEGLSLEEEDAGDIVTVINELDGRVRETYPEDSPHRIFWEQQKKYHSLNEKRQMKWHPLVLRFALNLKYISSSAYRAVRESGVIRLPSERTLSDYTHWATAHNGLQVEYVEHFKAMLNHDLPSPDQHQCALSMDEMKIKASLVFSKRSGRLVGFIDLGGVNRDIECLTSSSSDTISDNGRLADQAFVFMVRAVFKPSLSAPVAHYFSLNLKGEQMFPLVWEVVRALELYRISVVSVVSDGAKQNRRFYQMCQTGKQGAVPHKTVNPYRKNADFYFFCDAPHLLKTSRNCFSNSFAHSKSRTLKKNGQYISWKSIEKLYLTETSTQAPGLRLCHKLTRDHIWLTSFTRMRVHLAAQVMSESVASALEVLDRESTQETRVFIRMIDRFFDCLNVSTPMTGQLKRKENLAPYRSGKDERFKWLVEVFLPYLNDWEREAASHKELKKSQQQKLCLSRETLLGLRITVKSFTELGPKLLEVPGVNYLLSEVFSQDPLERYFSRQRHRGGSNDNPTAEQVPLNAMTLIQQQTVYRDLKTINVQSSRCQDTTSLSQISEPLKKKPRKR